MVVNYNGSADAANAVVEEMKANGGNGEVYQCTVSDFAAVEEMIKTLVKKAGTDRYPGEQCGNHPDDLLMKMKEEAFDAVIATNLKGSFNTMRHIARPMLKQKADASSIFHLSAALWEIPDR